MTFATIELSLLSVFGLLAVGSLLTMFFQWCAGLFDRSSDVENYTAGFEAACQPCCLNPIDGALPEPELYTEHSPQIVRKEL